MNMALDTTPPVSPFVLTNGSFRTAVDPQVTLVTTLGTVVFKLDAFKAPMSTANMLAYVNDGFYNGTVFHRVAINPSFEVVQGGGYTTGLVTKTPTYSPIPLESNNGLSNLTGTVGMARTSSPNTATSQFYVNVADNTGFDYAGASYPGYAVFGSVVSGMSVIQNMAAQPTSTANVPLTEILITTATESTIGVSKSNTGVVSVGALETGATWEYSLNSGLTWKKGKGSSFVLKAGTYVEHTIQVRQTDAAGNVSAHVGVSDVTMVVDRTAPKIASITPTNAAMGVATTENIGLTFNEEVVLGTGTITLKTAAGVVVKTFSVTPSATPGLSWNVPVASYLAYGTAYSLEIAKGTFEDVAGNAYAGLKKYKFSTTDTVTTTATTYTLGTEANKLAYSGSSAFTGAGNDSANVITGNAGNDTIRGFGGEDIIDGGAGADVLYGQDGSDTVTGGAGADYFVLANAANTGTDTFVDFTPGEDKIAFIQSKFSGLPATLTAAELLVGSGKSKPTAGQHLIYNTTSGTLYYDADGLAATAAIKVAIIGKAAHPTLSVSDFLMG